MKKKSYIALLGMLGLLSINVVPSMDINFALQGYILLLILQTGFAVIHFGYSRRLGRQVDEV